MIPIERELRDLLSTYLSVSAIAGAATITVPTDGSVIPDKCILTISNGRTLVDLLQAEVVAISANSSGVLTLEESMYNGVHKKITDGDWDGLQNNWAEGTEVFLFFNQMYYDTLKDAVNAMLTDNIVADGQWEFSQGIAITGEPDAGNDRDGAFRMKAGKLQARESGAWKDLLTRGLPGSPYLYGSLYYNPLGSWTANDQLRIRHVSSAAGPVPDVAGEVSIKRQLTIWETADNAISLTMGVGGLVFGDKAVAFTGTVGIDDDLAVNGVISTTAVVTPLVTSPSDLDISIPTDVEGDIRFFYNRDVDLAEDQLLTMYSPVNGIGFQFNPATGLTKIGASLHHSNVDDPEGVGDLMLPYFRTRTDPIPGSGLKILTAAWMFDDGENPLFPYSHTYISSSVDDGAADLTVSADSLNVHAYWQISTYVAGHLFKYQAPGADNSTGTNVLSLRPTSQLFPVQVHTNMYVSGYLEVANHIKIGDVTGDPEFGDIRYTSANAFEGYYEVSPGIGAWNPFRTEEANLPASTHGYMLRYEDGHWKGTGIIQAHDRGDGFIVLDNDVIVYGALRVANIGDAVDPMAGMIRYNGDFQGRMTLKNSSGEFADYWVSLSGGGIASGGQQGEMLVYNAEIERWVSAGGDMLWVDHQLTIAGRLVPQLGLTIPPAGRLPEDDMPDADLANQRWLQDNPVAWEAEATPQVTGPAPDGNWIRVLPASGGRKIDLVQVWGQIGEETFTSPDETPTTQTEPTYGWLNLVAQSETGDSATLPNPDGHNGDVLSVSGGAYGFSGAFAISGDAVVISREVQVADDLSCMGAFRSETSVTSAGPIMIDADNGAPDDDSEEPQNFFGIGKYDPDRKGQANQHNEDWMWQVLRKLPTTDTQEYYPGEQDANDDLIPLESYGKDDWDETDLVIQYHATARTDSLRTLLDSFTELDVVINNVHYSADGTSNSYVPNITITLESGLDDTVVADTTVSSFAGVFAKTVGSHAEGAVEITATILAPTVIAAFTSKVISIGGQSYTATTAGGAHATLSLVPNLVSPILANTSVSNDVCIFGKVIGSHIIGASTITVDPYLAPLVKTFTEQTIIIDAVSYLGASFGSRFDDNVEVILTPAIAVPLHNGDIVATMADGSIGLVDGEYPVVVDATTTTINMKRYYQAVEPVRISRGGNIWLGGNLNIKGLLTTNGPIVVGDFQEGVMTVKPGMIRYNGDFEGLLGDKWVSMTNRLALPQVPPCVLNFPNLAWWGTSVITPALVTDYGITPFEYDFTDVTGLVPGTLITFANGVAANVVSVAGSIVTLTAEVMPYVEIDGTLYAVMSNVGSVLTLVNSITFPTGTRVEFANGAIARLVEDVTASNTITVDREVAFLCETVEIGGITYVALRYNSNVLTMYTCPAIASGAEITLNSGEKVIATEDYPPFTGANFSDTTEIKVRNTELIGATLAYDELQGWHFNDTMIVKDYNVYLMEGMTFGPVMSVSPRAGMVQWNGDLEVWNGSAWASLTGYGTEHIAPSDEGNTLVMGETNWQANAQVTFLDHGGAGVAGILRVNNVLKLAEYDDDPIPTELLERGMVRHRGDLEYYTGDNWISLTDYYGLPGGHLPLPGRDEFGDVVPYTEGALVRYVLPEEGAPYGRWAATDILVITDDGIVTSLVSATGITLAVNATTALDDGTIRFTGTDFLGKIDGDWTSFTEKLGLATGDPYSTLYMHAYADDPSRDGAELDPEHRAYLPTSKFRMEVAYATGEDPPGDEPTSVKAVFECPVLITLPEVDPNPKRSIGFYGTRVADKVKLTLGFYDEANAVEIDNVIVVEEDAITINIAEMQFNANLNVEGFIVANTLGANSIEILEVLAHEGAVFEQEIVANGIQSTLGYTLVEIGTLLGVGINETELALKVNGLAQFSNTIVIGDQKSEAPEDGMIRYHSGDFQGWSGDHWISFASAGGPGSLTGPYEDGSVMVWSTAEDTWVAEENVLIVDSAISAQRTIADGLINMSLGVTDTVGNFDITMITATTGVSKIDGNIQDGSARLSIGANGEWYRFDIGDEDTVNNQDLVLYTQDIAVLVPISTDEIFRVRNSDHYLVVQKLEVVNDALVLGSLNQKADAGTIANLSSVFSSSAAPHTRTIRIARGTEASPTITVNLDVIDLQLFQGYDGSNYIDSAAIEVKSYLPTPGDVYAQISFKTWDGAALTEKLRVSSGDVRVFHPLYIDAALNCIEFNQTKEDSVGIGNSIYVYTDDNEIYQDTYLLAAGTGAALAAPADGTLLYQKYFEVYDSVSYSPTAKLELAITGTLDENDVPSEWRFYAANAGDIVSADPSLIVNGAGISAPQIAIGTGAAIAFLEEGSDTPTVTNVANAITPTSAVVVHKRVGNIVTVNVCVTMTMTTAAGTSTTVTITLPYASNIAFIQDATGTAVSTDGAMSAAIYGNPAGNNVKMTFLASTTASTTFVGTYQYEVI